MTLPSWNDGAAGGTPITAEALNERDAEIEASVKRWRPSTAYALAEKVVSPDGDIVSAAVAHVSGASYDPAAWTFSSTFEPALPAGGTSTKFLRGDRTWQTISLTGDGGGHDGSAFDPEVVVDVTRAEGPAGTQLTIPTHIDPAGGQTTHPSILFFPDGWNGYRYWLAHTPYNGGKDSYEDPNICASNDGITWVVPAGLTNPLDDQPGSPGAYNSDVDLKMGPNDTMYLFFRTYDSTATGQEEKLYYMTSTDGVNWSAKVNFYTTDQTVRRLVSPTFVFEDDRWVMWAIDIVTDPAKCVRLTCSTADPETPWSDPTAVSLGTMPSGKDMWHIFILKTGGRYFGLLADRDAATGGTGGELLLITSADGLTFTNSGTSVVPKTVSGQYDNLYRSTMIPAIRDGMIGFRIFYVGWQSGSPSVWKMYRSFINLSPAWVAVTPSTGWSNYSGGGGYANMIRYKRSGNSTQLEAMVAATNSTSAPVGSVVAIIPKEARPAKTFIGFAVSAGAAAMVQVMGRDADGGTDEGKVKFLAGTANPSYLNFNLNYQNT